jgi:PPM family protein phosphatase
VTQPSQSPAPPAVDESADTEVGGQVRMRLFARTDVGQVREHNEDNFLVADITKRTRGLLESNRETDLGPQGSLFAVCDGMGGAAAGEVASQLAVDIIFERLVDGIDDRAIARDELARRLVHAVEVAGFRIFQEAKADRSRRGMGTTVTAAALVDDHLFLAQVGDSRGYILRGDQLVQVTRDQSLVNQLIEAGQLTEEEAETFEHNNIILQALGTSDTVHVDLTYVQLRRGDMLMLCSDGLSGMLRGEEIREVLRSTTETFELCKVLIERANQAGGHDNVTVICVQFDGPGVQPLSDADEPLKYRKYALPEAEKKDSGAGDSGSSPSQAPPANNAGSPQREPSIRPSQRPNSGSPPAHAGDESIDIPGTHIPAWLVVVLVTGVIGLLAATAFVLLR